jgi:hypothetical protein
LRAAPAGIVRDFPGENPLHAAMVHDLYVTQVLVDRAEPAQFSAQFHRTRAGQVDLALAQMQWAGGPVASFTAPYLTPPGMAPMASTGWRCSATASRRGSAQPQADRGVGRASRLAAGAGDPDGFPLVALLRCLLHGRLAMRSRGKLNEALSELSKRVWEAFATPDRRSLGQRMRRLWEWAKSNVEGAWLLLLELVYSHPGGHRTSNMLDRVMRSMSRYFDDGQHWALLYNYKPWHPATARANGGWRSPAERLNRHRRHEDWLQNLLVSASLGGYRR